MHMFYMEKQKNIAYMYFGIMTIVVESNEDAWRCTMCANQIGHGNKEGLL